MFLRLLRNTCQEFALKLQRELVCRIYFNAHGKISFLFIIIGCWDQVCFYKEKNSVITKRVLYRLQFPVCSIYWTHFVKHLGLHFLVILFHLQTSQTCTKPQNSWKHLQKNAFGSRFTNIGIALWSRQLFLSFVNCTCQQEHMESVSLHIHFGDDLEHSIFCLQMIINNY